MNAEAVPLIEVGTQWWIGLSTWILQDGNYTDFNVGQTRQFALEFGYRRSRRLHVASDHRVDCTYTGRDTTYAVAGELLQVAQEKVPSAFVLDFGLRAYDEHMVLDDLEPPPAGSWLEGEISLHVDPFHYMDLLGKQPGMPALIYTWRVDEVQIATTPAIWVEASHPDYVGPDDGPMALPDPDRESWRSVKRTETWAENGGYRLRCTLVDDNPVSTMTASGRRSPYGPVRPWRKWRAR